MRAVFLLSVLLTACATAPATADRPTVLSVGHDAHVCLGGGIQPEVGEELRLIRRVCQPASPKVPHHLRCEDQLVSHGRVVATAADGCTMVRASDDEFLPRPGDRVETARVGLARDDSRRVD
jgi:hypothetical protein